MSGTGPSRGLLRAIWTNFTKSLQIARQATKEDGAKRIGQDVFGNTYFEIPADPR